jgi:hypothetical protein
MLKTLGLDDDLDPVEVVIAIEKAFEVKVSNEEAKAIFRVGELFTLLLSKMPVGDAGRKCASAMAFYRVRRALNELGIDAGRFPSDDLSSLHRVYSKSFVRSLKERSGLRLPRPAFGLVGKLGVAVLLVGLSAGLGTIALGLLAASTKLAMSLSFPPKGQLETISIALLVGAFVAGPILMYLDAGRLPANCRTLGSLAARTASLSYGRLVKQGADARVASVWKALTENLADFAGVPADQIARETYFLRSAVKGAAA